jgi:hypothetical protein
MARIIIDATNNYGELTKEEILDPTIRKTKRPPLQENTIYCYCKLKQHKIDCAILQKLIQCSQQSNEIQVNLPELLQWEKDYVTIDLPTHKDLIFKHNDEEIGWYNKENNILWISDIGHFSERVVKNFKLILSNIIEFNRTGSIPVLPYLLIGCDLEFELFDKNGNFIPANAYLHDIENRNHELGREVGLDGHPQTGEIRPAPANNPIKLAGNIRRTVKKLIHILTLHNPDIQIFCGGGLKESLGGHIHFNTEGFVINNNNLKYILYNLIGKYIKAGMNTRSVRIDRNEFMSKDAPDGFRTTESHIGWEWRCPPSFMLNEIICKSILCTTWCVIKEYYGYGFAETEYTRVHIEQDSINVLTTLHFYPYYKKWIDQFIDMFILNKTAMEGKDIKKEWNIVSYQYNITIFSELPWVEEYINSCWVDISRVIKIGIYKNRNLMFSVSTIKSLSKKLSSEIEEFAINHLVSSSIALHTDSTLDIIIYIPWDAPPDTKMASDKLKVILKKIIVEINKS